MENIAQSTGSTYAVLVLPLHMLGALSPALESFRYAKEQDVMPILRLARKLLEKRKKETNNRQRKTNTNKV